MNNKAQGLSMNVIIIAAIALLVLVVLAVLLFGSTSDIQETNACTGSLYNGQCVPSATSCPTGYILNPAGTGCNQGSKCCAKISGN